VKVNSITSSEQINEIKNSSKKYVGRLFLLIVSETDNPNSIDYLIIATKKIGSAVIRNKIKRRFRCLIRKNSNNMNPQYDYLFIAKKNMSNCSFEELEQQFIKAIKEIN
jgi:ribonuclease P protein component